MSEQLNRPIWDTGNALRLPSLSAHVEADTCVIGLGGSGLAAVHELLTLGERVIGIDAVGIGGGAAGRNGGFLLAGTAAFHHDAVRQLGRDRAVRLYHRTQAEIDRMTAETPAAIQRVGSLRIAASEDELLDCEHQYAAMIADNLPVEHYDGVEGRGLLFPGDGAFDPARRCALLARGAIDRGARLFAPADAIDITGTAVRSGRYTISCQRVIAAVDGGLARLFPELQSRVRTARLQMLATAPAPEVAFPRPVYLRYGYEYWQQLSDGRIALGGFRDQELETEWTDDGQPSDAIQRRLDHLLRTRLGVVAPVTHRWAASVGYSTGILPVVEEVRPGVWVAGGYNGTGNVIGAICGRGLARLAVLGDGEMLAEIRVSA